MPSPKKRSANPIPTGSPDPKKRKSVMRQIQRDANDADVEKRLKLNFKKLTNAQLSSDERKAASNKEYNSKQRQKKEAFAILESSGWAPHVTTAREALRDDEIGFVILRGLVYVDAAWKSHAEKQKDFAHIFNSTPIEHPNRDKQRMSAAASPESVAGLDLEILEAFMLHLGVTPYLGEGHKENPPYTWIHSAGGRSERLPQCAHTDFAPLQENEDRIPCKQGKAWKDKLEEDKDACPPVSTIIVCQEATKFLFYATRYSTKGRNVKHPSTQPSVRVHLQVGDVLVFRGDMFHNGDTYNINHFRLFKYWQSITIPLRFPPPETDTENEGHVFFAPCECEKTPCTCGPRKTTTKIPVVGHESSRACVILCVG